VKVDGYFVRTYDPGPNLKQKIFQADAEREALKNISNWLFT
jgi:hypothetical protein